MYVWLLGVSKLVVLEVKIGQEKLWIEDFQPEQSPKFKVAENLPKKAMDGQ